MMKQDVQVLHPLGSEAVAPSRFFSQLQTVIIFSLPLPRDDPSLLHIAINQNVPTEAKRHAHFVWENLPCLLGALCPDWTARGGSLGSASPQRVEYLRTTNLIAR